jgi:spermidine dehydrogenase
LANTPLSERARREIEQIQTGWIDYLPGLSSAAKKQRLSKISYAAFLTDIVRADPSVVAYYQARTHGEWGVGIDAVSALDCWPLALPGFAGMKLAHGSIAHMGYTPAGYADTGGSLQLHFLVRTLKDGGFDAANDITAIMVNRWPHGYAPEFNPLFDEELPESQQPHVIGRARFGRIVVANSDSGRAAYTDSANNQAHRAVAELLRA